MTAITSKVYMLPRVLVRSSRIFGNFSGLRWARSMGKYAWEVLVMF